ncbi:hypothetical protein Q4561_05220 [Alteromonas sp. 1_MG-2023]|uniref:hypothetical protein n=1 Tax=Alteromonas sp. 1_MG-2023 TaxID=3062669 RepID=UPI0026E4102B|nr:hypothetical protein [Alteromonas sp. 1_MG-2023]MDO6566449.1 hypothetical protein [Alteromonas sp. 1_MG-2023]
MKQGLFCLLLMWISTTVNAEKFIVGSQNIEYYPHYDFASSIDKGVGWAILEAFSEASGHEFSYLNMPIRRLQMEMLKGHVDFVYPDNPGWYNDVTKTKEKFFSLALTHAVTGTFVKPKNVNKGINSIRRIAMPLGFTPVNWQIRLDKNLVEIVSISDTYAGLSLLQMERVDAIDFEYHVGSYYTDRSPQIGPFVLDITLPHNEIPFMLSALRHPEIIEEFNDFITNNAPLINSIKARYGITSLKNLKQQIKNEYGITAEQIWQPQ